MLVSNQKIMSLAMQLLQLLMLAGREQSELSEFYWPYYSLAPFTCLSILHSQFHADQGPADLRLCTEDIVCSTGGQLQRLKST